MSDSDASPRRRTFVRARRAALGNSRKLPRMLNPIFVVGGTVAVSLALLVPLLLAALPVYGLFLGLEISASDRTPDRYGLTPLIGALLLAGFCARPVALRLRRQGVGFGAFFRHGVEGALASILAAPVLAVLLWFSIALEPVSGVFLLLLSFLVVPLSAIEELRLWPAMKRSFVLCIRNVVTIFLSLLLFAFLLMLLRIFVLGDVPGKTGPGDPAWYGGQAVLLLQLVLGAVLPTVVHHELTR